MDHFAASVVSAALHLSPGAHIEEVMRASRTEAVLWPPGTFRSARYKIPEDQVESLIPKCDKAVKEFIEANRNAAELIAEEEKSKLKEEQLKRKAERKRAKKKRRNERKKQQEDGADRSKKTEKGRSEAAATAGSSCSNDSGSDDPDNGTEQPKLDGVSAFVSRTALRKNIVLPTPSASSGAAKACSFNGDVPKSDASDTEHRLLGLQQGPLGLPPGAASIVGRAAGQLYLSQSFGAAEAKLSVRIADASIGRTAEPADAAAPRAWSAHVLTEDASTASATALPPQFGDPAEVSMATNESPVLLPQALASAIASSSNSVGSSYRRPSASGPTRSSVILSAAVKEFVPSAFTSASSSALVSGGGGGGAAAADPASMAGAVADEVAQQQAEESRCLELGRLGNSNALDGRFLEAIACYSEGIRIDPFDYRLLGNRSLCYERLMLYEEALSDADASIHAYESYIKGHFRRGVALVGLKRISEAEQAFEQALTLDPSDEDVRQELATTRTLLLVDMGFAEHEVKQALSSHDGSLQRVLETLLALRRPCHIGAEAAERVAADKESVMLPDLDDQWIESRTTHYTPDYLKHIDTAASSVPLDLYRSGSNIGSSVGRTSLWIGDLYEPISEKKLLKLFSRFGIVESIRLLPERHCGFVNFYQYEAAVNAMESLQHHVIGKNRLAIKFPDNN